MEKVEEASSQTGSGNGYVKGYVPAEPYSHKKEMQVLALRAQLDELDEKSARSIRAVVAGTAT